MRSQSEASDRDSWQPRLRDRLLLFDLDRDRYAVRAAAVSGLAECGPVREVPGAPRAVLGLVEWRGHLLTVLDLPHLLGHAGSNGPAHLIRLAPPLQGISLFLPVNVRMSPLAPVPVPAMQSAEPGAADTVRHEGQLIRLIDPSILVRRVEGELQEGRPA